MITLHKAVELFLGEYIPTTRRTYRYTLKPLMDYIGPARPLDKITPQDLLEYMQALDARPTLNSPASYNKHVKSIRTFFNWCIRAGFIQQPGPAKILKRKRRSKAISKDKAMPEHLYIQLLDYAKWEPRYHALVLFLGDTGCRIGGAAGLRWVQIDFDRRSAEVTEKGEKTRPVFFGMDCATALRAWRLLHPMLEGDYVFSAKGRRMKNDSLGQLFTRICQAARVGTWGPHSLRHRKGHQLADHAVPPSVAAQALGHENVMTTLEFYYPADWERVQAAMEKLATIAAEEPSKIRKLRT